MERKKLAVIISIVLVILIIVIVVGVVATRKKDDEESVSSSTVKAQHFTHAAVAADRKECSEIGRDILLKNGSAVDAAVATLFCVGLLNMHSCGIGGGGFMNVYLRDQKKSIIYDFRETAPLNASKEMFKKENTSSVLGGLAIAVPGNVKGLSHVWKKHGKLPWKDLVEPTIKLAEEGFVLSKAVGDKIVSGKEKLENNAGFRELLQKPDGTWYKTGDTVKNQKLANTLKIIQNDSDAFYTGDLAKEIIADITEAGGIISLDDLRTYTVAERKSLVDSVNGLKMYLMPPPGSGAVIGMTMNILKGYNLTKEADSSDEKRIQTFHKIIEAMKFAFARRPLLGDPTFEVNVTKVTDAMLNQSFADLLRRKILPSSVYPNQTYYGGYYSAQQDPYGTTHVSILAENGDAVATTDTINYGFGSGIRSTRNGIIYNNEMDDFSTPGLQNLWGYLPAAANFIKPGKRPLSSMSPTIVVNSDGDVIMVAGASGGSRIITSTALTLIRKLYMNEELGKCVSDHRVHTHLLPYEVYVSKSFPIAQSIIDGLKKIGHKIVMSPNWSAVQALFRSDKDAKIAAKSDPRKGGVPAGY